jgi:hypothetical protein
MASVLNAAGYDVVLEMYEGLGHGMSGKEMGKIVRSVKDRCRNY